MDLEKVSKIQAIIGRIENKQNKLLFFVPDSDKPNASVYEIYFHATVMKRNGYNVLIITEDDKYVVPTWIESELTNHEHIAATNTKKLSVNRDDVVVVPDVFTNIMEQLKSLPCMKIAFLQSIDWMVGSLIPGTSFGVLGFKNIITTSQELKNLFENFYGDMHYDIKTYKLGIPDYFCKSEVPQKPVISIVGRNGSDIQKIVKLFYAKYPHFSWVTFDPLYTNSNPPQHLNRMDFAERLKGNFAAVWVDRLSSFGTFPLECMKSGVIPICLKPDIHPEYILSDGDTNTSNGIWVDNIYEIPYYIGLTVTKFLDDSITDEVYAELESVAAPYNQTDASKQIVELYQYYMGLTIKELEAVLEMDKKSENE